ncbi:MAG TPA: hypothetical protein VKM94_14410 [Blastocatellia bacterium]|nr:hypothetical protein [Blastocatellia bacterium]
MVHDSARQRGLWRDVLPVWAVLMAATCLPYLIAALRTPAGYRFTGVLTAYDDTFTYFAWMRQAADGRLLMCDLYTTEPQSCEFLLPLWIALGWVVRVFHLPIILVFHLARAASTLVMLAVTRGVVAIAMRSRRRIRLSLWLFAFSGGIGWLIYLLNSGGDLFNTRAMSGSADLNLPEAIAFRSAFSQVHFALGITLVAGSLRLLCLSLYNQSLKQAAIAGVLVTLLAVIHPYLVLVVGVVAALWLLCWPLLTQNGTARPYVLSISSGAAVLAGSLPGLAYLIYLNRTNQVLREWLKITDTLSPPPQEYVLGFGLVGALSVAGFVLLANRRKEAAWFLILWSVSQAAMLYAPVNFQRRFVEALQVPLVIAAAVAISWLTAALRRKRILRRIAIIGIVLTASLTNLGFVAGQILARGSATGASDPRRYIQIEIADSLNWIRANSDPGDTILCSYLTGNLLPGLIGRHVFLGHYGQTMHSREKGEQINRFYSGQASEAEVETLFEVNRVRYVIAGPFEDASEAATARSSMTLVHTVGNVRVYAVQPYQR